MKRWLVVFIVLLAGCSSGARTILDAGDCDLVDLADEGEDFDGIYYKCTHVKGAASQTLDLACDGPLMAGAEMETEPTNGTVHVQLFIDGSLHWEDYVAQPEHFEEGDEAWKYVEAGGEARLFVMTLDGFDGALGFGIGCL